MIKKTFFFIVLLCSVFVNAQENTSSPYSFFGVGINKFNGTAENRSMAGMGIVSDSIHINLQNPAGYGALGLTAYTLGGSHSSTKIESSSASDKASSSTFDYLAMAFPAGKLGFGLGVIPYSSVGYEMEDITSESASRFSGSGGLNKLFLAVGYEVTKELRVGVEGSYNFGNIKNKNFLFQNGLQFGTRETNRSDLSGFKVNFGAQYEKHLKSGLQLSGSASFSPSTKINAENQRQLATLILNSNNDEILADIRDIEQEDTELTLPSELKVGGGIGQPKKWFAGVEYGRKSSSDFTNRSFQLNNVNYTDASSYKLGGYYIPNYNDITSYFQRIVYRAGFRYEETGLNINTEDVNEFGISFGVGLPAGNFLTNVNLGVEYGERGTTSNNLVKEQFVNVFLSLSLNDKWFIQRRFD
ncbi:hypothetical protein ACFQ3R_07470 [Mesonia ostreae]|uniref:Long-subunit fatty acid transport protein n=1 Tax=Mesonia ostreae TaxID=861110 RepID=A0ABU2KHJ1_9FLAO|nr:hypothetical protein [Mesonia ostreae]MDT0294175.1 hypothetical protein [Mesonia ostreae]